MQLLTPEIIDTDKKRGIEETRVRVSALAREETEIVFRINLLRQDEEDIAANNNKSLAAFQEFEEQIEKKKVSLLTTIRDLEARKKKALEPIDKIAEKANALLSRAEQMASANQQTQSEIAAQTKELGAREKEIDKRTTALEFSEKTFALRVETLDKREAQIVLQSDALTKAKEAHKKHVEGEGRKIADGVLLNINNARTNTTERDMLAQRAKDLDERERQIVDRYATLESAERELKGKKKLYS